MNRSDIGLINYIACIDSFESVFDDYIRSLHLQRFCLDKLYFRDNDQFLNLIKLSNFLKTKKIKNCLILASDYYQFNLLWDIESLIPDGNFVFFITHEYIKEVFKKIVIQGVPANCNMSEFKAKAGAHLQKIIINQKNLVDQKKEFPLNIGEMSSLVECRKMTETSQFHFFSNNFRFDCIYKPLPLSDTLLIINQSAVGQPKNTPQFQRWSWAEDFFASTLCVNDPMLNLNPKLNCGWWIGSESCDLIAIFIEELKQLIKKLSIKKVIFYGGSAGGFSSLQMACQLPKSIAVVDITQTNLLNYHFLDQVKQAFESGFEKNSFDILNKKFIYRLDVYERIKKMNCYPNIIFLQNINDHIHINKHLVPFIKKIQNQLLYKLYTYDIIHPQRGGHTPLGRYETAVIINSLIKCNKFKKLKVKCDLLRDISYIKF